MVHGTSVLMVLGGAILALGLITHIATGIIAYRRDRDAADTWEPANMKGGDDL